MGYGTGILQAYHVYYFNRGLTTTILGATSLQLARDAGIAQNNLLAMRGLGFVIGPALSGPALGKAMWSGNSQSAFIFLLLCKASSQFAVPHLSHFPVMLGLALFQLGFSMGVIATLVEVLVCKIYKEKTGIALTIYFGIYAVGGMCGPYVTIYAPNYAWQIMGWIDVALAAIVLKNRLLKGKPRNWKAKIRGNAEEARETDASKNLHTSTNCRKCPTGVYVRCCMFVCLSEAIQTAMSSWIFTFLFDTLGQTKSLAAFFSSFFYVIFIVTQAALLPLQLRLRASVFVQFSIIIIAMGALVFCHYAEQATSGRGVFPKRMLLLGVALLGVGTCPLGSNIIAAMRYHGDISAERMGFFCTSATMGTMLGMWIPGLVALSRIQLIWAAILTALGFASCHDVPLWSFN